MSINSNIEKLAELAKLATPGPWQARHSYVMSPPEDKDDLDDPIVCYTDPVDATGLPLTNAAYIAHIDPNLALRLIAAFKELRAIVQVLANRPAQSALDIYAREVLAKLEAE